MKPLARQFGISFLLKGASGGIGFLTTVVLGRTLGASGSGVFFLALSILTISSAVSRLGFDQAITRRVAQLKENNEWPKINSLHRRTITYITVCSCLFSAILYTLAPTLAENCFQNPKLLPALRWACLSIPPFSLTWAHSHFFQGIGKISLFQTFQNLCTYSIFLTLWFSASTLLKTIPQTAQLASALFAAACYISATASIITWQKTTRQKKQSPTDIENLEWCRDVSPLFGMLIISQLLLWTPQIILGAFWEESQVGIYTASLRLANLVSLILVGVNSVVFPRFAALHARGDHDNLKALAQRTARLMLIGCLPFLISLLMLPNLFLSLFGKDFTAGSTVLQIITLGQFFNVATGSVGGLLNMTGNQGAAFKCLFASLLVALMGSFALIPSYGAEGAAVSQSLSISIAMTLLTVTATKRLGFTPISLKPPSLRR
ncbi:flippase [Crateriforma conspicua]|uniref:Stage V sporulation protein B n=1 Tax=Crateriforma conspicua TaxID=2527996 RepID=A0A5C6FYZ2_9PLAN|nr:flippase [Crateriforma conspicua]TWU67586.1 Stage V sporulation protein B [Crateriforma conspicua]